MAKKFIVENTSSKETVLIPLVKTKTGVRRDRRSKPLNVSLNIKGKWQVTKGQNTLKTFLSKSKAITFAKKQIK